MSDSFAIPGTPVQDRRRSLALWLLCLGVLMIVLDTTIITVALPTMVVDLKLTNSSLTWVVNAYMLTFGGLMLLSGKLGDLHGKRQVFLVGLATFTLASLLGGFAQSSYSLICARAVQGIGGAAITGVSLSLITQLFPEPSDRARAMGLYGSVCALGGGIGELLGGVLTQTLSWHWIFLVNVPIGAAIYIASARVLPRDPHPRHIDASASPGGGHAPTATSDEPATTPQRLDLPGAFTVTGSLTLLVYTLANANDTGWPSPEIRVPLASAIILMLAFLWIESRSRAPLMPLTLLRSRNFVAANTVIILSAAASFSWFVLAALYLQRVANYNPLQVGLAFLPTELIMATFSAGLSAKLVTRLGIARSLWIGLLLTAIGLALFARAPESANFLADVLPGMIIIGLGTGITSTPMMMAAMHDAPPDQAGLISGLTNTFYTMGGTIGLAVLATLADSHAGSLQHTGTDIPSPSSLASGYAWAFLLGATLTTVASALAAFLWRDKPITRALPSEAPAL